MREIDLTEDLLPRHSAALRALQIVSTKVSVGNWCLVGGLMVLTAAREVGRPLARAETTKDADVVVDVCADSKALRDFAYQLNGSGYDIPVEAWEQEGVARCTFVSGYTAIDVLAQTTLHRKACHLEIESRALQYRVADELSSLQS